MSATSGHQHAPVFRRSESSLAHAVYGLILTLATVGELIHVEASAWTSVGWLLGAGGVLLAAHMFSDVLANTVATKDDLRWSRVLRIGREELSVVAGAVGAAAIMTLVALADLDSQRGLSVCLVLGLATVAALSFFASAHHPLWTRLLLAAVAALIGSTIVALENVL
ncbi:MAG: hypothetical protein ACR2OH_03545 [Microthrixaceae bacterium]